MACLLAGAGSCVIVLVAVMLYSHNQLLLLSGEPSFETPESGMIEIYGGRNRVQITWEGEEFFRDLHYVGAVVESEHCRRGPRCPVDAFFLEVDHGWVAVSESRFPWLIAAGKKLLDVVNAG